MSIFKRKAFISSKVEGKHKKKIPPVSAWGNYRKVNRPYCEEKSFHEKKLLVSIDRVSLAYEGRTVISELSMQIYSGDYICIVGENGSGKTTLMNALLGLKKPCGGSITLHGLKRNQIGVLPQKTPVQNDFCALVEEIVLSGRVGKKFGPAFYNRQDRQIAFENMEKLGITPLLKSSFRELSGGQQQRVLLARALCATEKLIVLDEPATGLDTKTQLDMYNLLRDINERENIAVVMVSHDIEVGLKYANKVLHINKNGVFFGDKEEYLSSGYAKPQTRTDASYGNSDAYRYVGGEYSE